MIEIENTGERIIVERETPLMIARHLCAYCFASEFVKGKEVLDIGSGEGYGSSYLAGFARTVTGIDYNGQAVAYARSRYRKDNLRYEVMDIKDLSRLQRAFDCVCCFQVIEHIRDTKMFLEGVRLALGENGVFICSTPNRLDASPGSIQPCNKFHVKEYLLPEFKELLGGHFSDVTVFGLQRGGKLNFYRRLKKTGIFNFLPPSVNPVRRFYSRVTCDNFDVSKDGVAAALDFIALCKK